MRSASEEPIITVTIRGGLADRHRLPLKTVLKFLSEFGSTLNAIGGEISAERGGSQEIDFGLEVVADSRGDAFSAGSLRARIAITRNAEVGILAASRVMEALSSLNRPLTTARKKPTKAQAAHSEQYAAVVHRLDRLAFINTSAKAEATFRLNRVLKASIRPKDIVLGQVAITRIREMDQKPMFVEHGVTVFGKLYQLKDKSAEFSEDSTGFWGELRMDNGERWRIKFGPALEKKASSMFRKQVEISGEANYFKNRSPRMTAQDIVADGLRDYEAAYDELFGVDKAEFSGVSLEALLESRYDA